MSENSYVTMPDENGSINISEEVVAIIASAAAAEVDGVKALVGAGGDFAEKFGKKNPAKGIRVVLDEENGVTVNAYVVLNYGFTVTDIAREVQKGVATAVESMTGLTVRAVNVHVTGIAIDN